MLSTTMSLSSMLSSFEELEGNATRYIEELVFVDREDGLGLEGAIIRPCGRHTRHTAIIWIHGNTSRFYDIPYIQVGREMAALGYTFITGSTHGHDATPAIRGLKSEAVAGWACWEQFDETPLDVAAWVGFAMQEGFKSVVLVGHSFGANKVIYYQARRQDRRVLGVVSASGDIKWKSAPERVRQAEEMEAAGRADQVLTQLEVPWYSMTARTYLGRARIAQHIFSSQSQTPYIAQVECPILAFYGSEEEWCGTAADLDIIRENAAAAVNTTTRILDDADHVYWNRAADAAALIAGWTDGLQAA